MKDNGEKYDIPDFGPDDDTEDMTGISIYDPHSENEDEFTALIDYYKNR